MQIYSRNVGHSIYTVSFPYTININNCIKHTYGGNGYHVIAEYQYICTYRSTNI